MQQSREFRLISDFGAIEKFEGTESMNMKHWIIGKQSIINGRSSEVEWEFGRDQIALPKIGLAKSLIKNREEKLLAADSTRWKQALPLKSQI